jgi:acyl-CoA synthetase (AMP-forming)/AMP-acid ligase II
VKTVASLESEDGEGGWKTLFYQRLRQNPYPLFVFPDCIIPAASVWSGARLWVHAFRAEGFTAGDRILLSLPASPEFLQILVAALCEKLTIALAPPTGDVALREEWATTLDVRAIIASGSSPDLPVWIPSGCEGPTPLGNARRETHLATDTEARFLLRTSGSLSGTGKWVALSDNNVLSVLNSHIPALHLRGEATRSLSCLPWFHAFGLVIDLLPTLLTGCEIVRSGDGGRNIHELLRLGRTMEITHFCAVPMTVRQLREHPDGEAFLLRLEEGVIGGAPIDAELAEFLRRTRLRVGYGQTEASPGITLGAPGDFPGGNYLGKPVGCQIRIAPDGTLHFHGDNRSYGAWDSQLGVVMRNPEGQNPLWWDTGDLVQEDSATGNLFFMGRKDDTFKLENGRLIEAGRLENAIRQMFPHLQEVMLYTPDNRNLALALTVTKGTLPTQESLADILGNLAERLIWIHAIPITVWERTPKGEVARRATLQRLANLPVSTRRSTQ